MLLEGLVLANFGFTCYDLYLTKRRMHDYGIDIEMSTWLRFCCKAIGIEAGLVGGMMLPFIGVLFLLYAFKLTLVLAFILGVKVKLFQNQLISLVFERDAKLIRKAIEEHQKKFGDPGAQTLQAPTSTGVEDTSQGSPSIPKEDK
jgi:hypothetical protein